MNINKIFQIISKFLLIGEIFGESFYSHTLRKVKEVLPMKQSVSSIFRRNSLAKFMEPKSFRCWRCDYDRKDQCVKKFDFTKYAPIQCDGKCIKSFKRAEIRTREDIEKAENMATTRKCVSRIELDSLTTMGMKTPNGCQILRLSKTFSKVINDNTDDIIIIHGDRHLFINIQLMYRKKEKKIFLLHNRRTTSRRSDKSKDLFGRVDDISLTLHSFPITMFKFNVK
ncbi:hypothetical protein SNEBB_008821 [Seison nebaliae]|nr:hypothetical protein SNEBB_008821 [Seison nebaliae]